MVVIVIIVYLFHAQYPLYPNQTNILFITLVAYRHTYSISQEICTRFFFAVLCCGYTLTDFPISIRLTSLALWQSNDCPSASKATWWIWINTSCEFIMNDCITTTKQSTTKPCAYFLGYTVTIQRTQLHLTDTSTQTRGHFVYLHDMSMIWSGISIYIHVKLWVWMSNGTKPLPEPMLTY